MGRGSYRDSNEIDMVFDEADVLYPSVAKTTRDSSGWQQRRSASRRAFQTKELASAGEGW